MNSILTPVSVVDSGSEDELIDESSDEVRESEMEIFDRVQLDLNADILNVDMVKEVVGKYREDFGKAQVRMQKRADRLSREMETAPFVRL